MGELLRLLHAARRSGVLGQIMDTMEVGEQPAAMSDATKRRKNEPEELSSDSEWDATVGRSSDSPAIDNQARYVTEGDSVVAKPIKKEKGGKSSAVKTPDTSNVRHVEKSIAVPPGVADFKEWSQTVIVMDKYADMNWSFSELIAASEGDAKIARYITWIVGTYATPCRQRSAEPGGRFWYVCQSLRLENQAKGISKEDQVDPCWISMGISDRCSYSLWVWLQSIAL